MTPAEFRAHAERFVAARRMTHPGSEVPTPRALDEATLARVRACRAELLARWAAVGPGEAMELEFRRA